MLLSGDDRFLRSKKLVMQMLVTTRSHRNFFWKSGRVFKFCGDDCHAFPHSQSVFLLLTVFCVVGCIKIEIYYIHIHALALSSRMSLFNAANPMFLAETVTYTYRKMQFWATCTCIPYFILTLTIQIIIFHKYANP